MLKSSSEIETYDWLSKDDFDGGKFNLAPSFNQYIPYLVKEGYL